MSWQGGKPSGFALKVAKAADERIKRMAGDILVGVVTETPVDTGQARSNWNLAIGETDYSTTSGNSDSIGRGLGKLSVSEILGQPVIISNSLPYIVRLNEGWSQQAPAKFVEKVVANVSSKYK